MPGLKAMSIFYFSRVRQDIFWLVCLLVSLLFVNIPFSENLFPSNITDSIHSYKNVLVGVSPLLGFFFALKWFSGIDNKEIAGTKSCLPEIMLIAPTSTLQLMLVPSVFGALIVALSRLITNPDTIWNEGLIAAVSTVATYFWLQAIIWQPFPFRHIRTPLIIVLVIVAYVINFRYRNSLPVELDMGLLVTVSAIAISGYIATFFAVNNTRHGTGRFSFSITNKKNKNPVNTTLFKSPLHAQLEYERGISGFGLQILFIVIALLPIFLYLVDQKGQEINQNVIPMFFLCLLVFPIGMLFFLGITRGPLLTQNDIAEVKISPFFAVLPVSTAQLMNAKYFRMAVSGSICYGIYFVFCLICFTKYSIFYSNNIIDSHGSVMGWALLALIFLCAISYGSLSYMCLPWFGLVTRKKSKRLVQSVITAVILLLFYLAGKIIRPYIVGFGTENIADIKLALTIIGIAKCVAIAYLVYKFKQHCISLKVLLPFSVAWLFTIVGIYFIGYKLVPNVYFEAVYILLGTFVAMPMVGIMLSYWVFWKSRFE